MPERRLIKIGIGLVYTYVGLVLFLTGVNVGFSPAGNSLGQVLAALPYRWVIVPIGMLIGYFIVRAEPAVFVLTKQVEEITDGAISAESMGLSLSIGVSMLPGAGHDPRADGAFHLLVYHSRLLHRAEPVVLCAEDFHGHRALTPAAWPPGP